MGNAWRKIRGKFYGNMDVRVLMYGLDAAGKTTILYKLKLGEVITTIPTIGFIVDTISYQGINFTTWEVGGRSGNRAQIRHYLHGIDVLLLVVDSDDRERIEECRDELSRLLCEDELKDCCLLVMANKQDLPNAMSLQEVTEKLDLNKLPPSRAWHIESTCVTKGDGLNEGLKWLHSYMTTKQVKKAISQPTTEVKESLMGKDGFFSSWFSSLSKYFTRKDTPLATESLS